MPNKKIKVSIPKACEVNLDEMQTVANGKFCTHCSKTVWDFRNWSEKELGHFFANSEQLVCGRFAALQLNTPLPVPSQSHYGKIAAAALGFSLFLAQDALAQHKTPLKPNQNIVSTQRQSMVQIKGVVNDENGITAPSIAVNIFANGKFIKKVFTKSDGTFDCYVSKNLIKPIDEIIIKIDSSRFEPFEMKITSSDGIDMLKLQLKFKKELPRIIDISSMLEDSQKSSNGEGSLRIGGSVICEDVYIVDGQVVQEAAINSNHDANKRTLKNTTNPTYNEQEIINRGGIDQIVKDIPQR